MAVGPVPDPLTGQHTLTETEGGVPEALDGLYVEYLRRSGEAGLPPPPGDGAPQAQAWTGGAGALDDGVARRPASGRRRAHGEQHIVRGGELA